MTETIKGYHATEEMLEIPNQIGAHEVELSDINKEIEAIEKLLNDGDCFIKKSYLEKCLKDWKRLKKEREEYDEDEAEKNEPPYLQDWEN